MFCGNCGTENENGAKFCKSCGKRLGTPGKQQGNTVATVNNATDASVRGASKSLKGAVSLVMGKIKSLPKKALIGACAAVVLFIAIIFISVNSGKTINLNNYLTVTATGYDGYGNASTSIDWAAIEEKYGNKLSFTKQAKKEFWEMVSMGSPIAAMQEFVNIKIDQASDLSNGDKIKYTWEIDESLSKYIKGKVKYKNDSYTVSELTTVGKFDPFTDLTILFSGIAPKGTADFEYSGSELNYYDFSCEKSEGLRNGDKIKININNPDMQYYAENYGKVPEKLEMEYTVSGLAEYVEDYANLSEDFLSDLKSETEDIIYAYTASSYENSVSLNDLSYFGYISSSIKDGSVNVGDSNYLLMIYSGTVSDSEGHFRETKVYFPVAFMNIISENNSLSYKDNYGIQGVSYLDGSWYSTKGYINPLNCYIDFVEEDSDNYNVEYGDGFEAYANLEQISSLSDISDKYKESLHINAKNTIENYIANNYNGGSEALDLQVAGEYLLIAKNQGSDFAANNKYYVIFSAIVSNTNGAFETTTVYFPVEYDGIVKLPGDEYLITASQGLQGNSSLPNSWYSTKGYTDGSQMYSDIITSNRENYTYEVSDSLEEFGK